VTFLKDHVKEAALVILVTVCTYLFVPSPSTLHDLLDAAIALAVILILIFARHWAPRAVRWIAKTCVRNFIYGLYAWGASAAAQAGDDTIWEWLTDQIFVVQRRYAFSVSCIAFRQDSGPPQACLMVQRTFSHFGEEPVLLWPGGRVRGAKEDFESEVRGIVYEETGCAVTLIAAATNHGSAFSEKVYTYNPQTGAPDLENYLLQPPIMVMKQSREQSHEVPGHIDLIFLAQVDANQQPRKRGVWLEISGMDNVAERRLWPDTRKCIREAAELYERHFDARDHPAI
jgi:hypothetical protein